MGFIQYDLGRIPKGSTVVVSLDSQANVLLLDQSNFNSYRKGNRASFYGGLVKRSPARIGVPRTAHWYIAIDLGGRSGKIRSGVDVEPPPRGDLPTFRQPGQAPIGDRVGLRQNPEPPSDDAELGGRSWDVFLSHASEDKAAVAIPLAQNLQDRGITVWLDEAELRIGDSLRKHIDVGITSSRFAAVVFSDSYFNKGWPQYELDGIVNLTIGGKQALLPIWHEIDRDGVSAHSPSLADKFARSTSEFSIEEIADEIAEVVKNG